MPIDFYYFIFIDSKTSEKKQMSDLPRQQWQFKNSIHTRNHYPKIIRTCYGHVTFLFPHIFNVHFLYFFNILKILANNFEIPVNFENISAFFNFEYLL